MYTRVQQAQQKYGGSLKAIDSWLQERRELIVSYCRLAGLPPFEKDRHTMPSQDKIKEFCQLLMDYLSAGHFEVYEQIVSQCAVNGADSKALAESLYPKISVSTDLALEFNDRYAETAELQDSTRFDQDLSRLGQALEERFSLEDELIQTLSVKHKGHAPA